jgi:predicted RNA binding protein YcfA (HicA-like mRNA interferase family)
MKVRDVIRRLEADGWELVRQRGSHTQFRHRTMHLESLREAVESVPPQTSQAVYIAA